MAVVVVLIMISFVLGAALQQLASRMGNNPEKPFIEFEGGTVSVLSQNVAEAELNVLAALGVSDVLLARDPQRGQITQRNVGWLLLHQMLYPEVSSNLNLNQTVKALARQKQLGFSEEMIDKFFNQSSVNPTLNWILLKAEADKYGITVLPEQAEEMIDKAGLAGRVSVLARNTNLATEEVYGALADFSAVRMLISYMCGGDNTTISQVQNVISSERETFDYEFVRFSADMFVDEVKDPTEQEIKEHFAKYKDVKPGSVSEDNPFGFGYMLPERVKLEYALLDLEQIEEQVQVTEEETEQFYQRNLDQMKRQVRQNPDDPNSPIVTETLRYSQVVNVIEQQLRQNKIQAKAQEIINAIKDTAAASFENVNREKASPEQLKEQAESYKSIAKMAEEKFNVDIEAGTTSYVSATNLAGASVLGNMALVENQKATIGLIRLLFSIDALSDVELYGFQKPDFYESIGMLRSGDGGKVGLVRIVGAEKARSPQSLDTVIDVNVPYKENAEPIEFSIREKVVENIKLARAFDIAAEKADQFAKAVEGGDWKAQIEKFNEQIVGADVNDANAAKLEIVEMQDRSRITQMDIEMTKALSQGQSFSSSYVKQTENVKKLLDEIYGLADANLPAVIEVKPDGGVYVIKDVSIDRLNVTDYEQAKMQMSMVLDERSMEICSLYYLMPDNLKERMNYKLLVKQEPADINDVNEVTETNDSNEN